MDEEFIRVLAALLAALSARYHAQAMPADIRPSFRAIAELLDFPLDGWRGCYAAIEAEGARRVIEEHLRLCTMR